MTVELLAEAVNISAEAKPLWDDVYTTIISFRTPDGQGFDTDQIIPSTAVTLTTLNERATGLFGGISGFAKVDNVALVPDNVIPAIHTAITQIRDLTLALKAQLAPIEEQGVGLIDTTTFVVHNSKQNQSVNVAAAIKPISQNLNTALLHYFMSAQVLEAPNYPGFSSALNQISSLLDKSVARMKDIENLDVSAKAHFARIEEVSKDVENNRAKVVTDLTETNRVRDEISKSKQTADQQVAETEAIVSKATELKSAVDTHSAQFDAYQENLDRREAAIQSANEQLDKLVERAKEHEGEVTAVIERAESMLAGAT